MDLPARSPAEEAMLVMKPGTYSATFEDERLVLRHFAVEEMPSTSDTGRGSFGTRRSSPGKEAPRVSYGA